tara:strand:- start:687 stop:1745 length:1059 start_codon:yes stop_codon:yes gene_type:complete
MARSFTIGGPSATGIATGVPYIRRIVRRGSSSASHHRYDKLTHYISGHPEREDINGDINPAFHDGRILATNKWFFTDDGHRDRAEINPPGWDEFEEDGVTPTGETPNGLYSWQVNSASKSRGWNFNIAVGSQVSYVQQKSPLNDDHLGGWPGEAMHIEFPAPTRTFSVQYEASNYSTVNSDGTPIAETFPNRSHRVRIMLTCPGLRVDQLDDYGNPQFDDNGNRVCEFMDPLGNGNYIELKEGETATFDVKTSHFFIFLITFDTDNVFDDDLSGDVEGFDQRRRAEDAVSLLVTAILEHDGTQSKHGTATKVIGANGQEREPVKKVYPQSTNINQDYTDHNGNYIGNTSGVG